MTAWTETQVTTKLSPRPVAATVSRLTAILAARGIKVFAVIDQSEQAREAGLTLRETTLVIFGNPAAGTPVMDAAPLAALDLPAIGPEIEHHSLFPNRTNVSWFAVLAPGRIRARIFERGVGETLASGTGATGAAVTYALQGGESPVTVVLDGGELEVDVGEDLHINLTGWAVPVFRGELAPEFLEELNATQ